MYADMISAAYHNPLRWSAKKSFELTRNDVLTANPDFARPIYIKEYVGGAKSKHYKVSSMKEFYMEHSAGEANLPDPIRVTKNSLGSCRNQEYIHWAHAPAPAQTPPFT